MTRLESGLISKSASTSPPDARMPFSTTGLALPSSGIPKSS